MNINLLKKTRSILQYASDIHLEKGFQRNITPHKPFLVLNGDIGYPHENSYKHFLLEMSFFFDKVFIIPGNHEFDDRTISYDDTEISIKNICNMRNNLIYLQKSRYLIDKKDNIFIAGCTLFSEFPLSKQPIHINHSKWLIDLVKSNKSDNYVITTHHCPHINLLLGGNYKFFNPKYFASDQTNVFENRNVFMWIYGHSHYNKEITMKNTLFTTNQYGKYEHPLMKYKQ